MKKRSGKSSARHETKHEVKVHSGNDNSFGIAGVVLGIFSLASLSFPGIILAIVGLVFSMKQKNIHENKWSKAGMILNILGIIFTVIATIIGFYLLTQYGDLSSIGLQ